MYGFIQKLKKLRALDKMEYLMISFLILSSKPYVVTPHLNRLVETVQLSGYNVCFYAELKIIPKYSLLSTASDLTVPVNSYHVRHCTNTHPYLKFHSYSCCIVVLRPR